LEHPIQELASLLAPHAANLCNHCLGRQFARIAPPEGNEVRGRRIRDEIGQPAPQRCSLCEDLPKRIPRWADLCVSSAAGYEYATFLVGCIVFDEIKSREEALHTRLREADVGALAAS
jgi:tRNA pseudouridine synthase 10